MARRPLHGPIVCWILAWPGDPPRGLTACWILAQTPSLATWSLQRMCSILQQHPISMGHTPPWSSATRVHDSQAHRKMDATRERISRIPEPRTRHPKLVSTLSMSPLPGPSVLLLLLLLLLQLDISNCFFYYKRTTAQCQPVMKQLNHLRSKKLLYSVVVFSDVCLAKSTSHETAKSPKTEQNVFTPLCCSV